MDMASFLVKLNIQGKKKNKTFLEEWLVEEKKKM